jgi:hypothetical protein
MIPPYQVRPRKKPGYVNQISIEIEGITFLLNLPALSEAFISRQPAITLGWFAIIPILAPFIRQMQL